MGMGNEGHTASLFPGTKALHETKRTVVRTWVGKLYTERITLTAPAINSAARIMFLITGADKALALKGVLEGPYEPDQLPAQMIQPLNGKAALAGRHDRRRQAFYRNSRIAQGETPWQPQRLQAAKLIAISARKPNHCWALNLPDSQGAPAPAWAGLHRSRVDNFRP